MGNNTNKIQRIFKCFPKTKQKKTNICRNLTWVHERPEFEENKWNWQIVIEKFLRIVSPTDDQDLNEIMMQDSRNMSATRMKVELYKTFHSLCEVLHQAIKEMKWQRH